VSTDIHWVIERKHADGGWEAIASRDYLWEEVYPELHALEDTFERTAFVFGRRNYGLFGILSNIRYIPPHQGRMLATPGLPENASDYSVVNLGDGNQQESHTPGHYTLARLRSVVEDDTESCAPGEDSIQNVRNHHDLLEKILSGASDIDLEQILIGPEGCVCEPRFPEMKNMSNHRRLELEARARGLLPIAGDTVRVIFAYDN
jgi:hypothetical protein